MKKVNLSLLGGDVIIENIKDCTKGFRTNFLQINNKLAEKEISKSTSFMIASEIK